jgi:DNA-binding response OmpR family regulator
MKKVLAIVSDERIRQEIGELLSAEDIALLFADNSETGIEILYGHRPELVIVNTPVAGIGGSDLCRLIRKSGIATSIIFLVSAPDVLEAVLLLELGADDVIVRPFYAREFQARVRLNIRRASQGSALTTLRFGDVEIDFERRSVSRQGKPVGLARNEYNLLVYFIRNAGKALTRDAALNAVWGYDFCPMTRTVDAHVAKLRSKLELDPRFPRYIITLHGVGYRFVISHEHDAPNWRENLPAGLLETNASTQEFADIS